MEKSKWEISRSELAGLFGITPRSLHNYTSQHGMPGPTRERGPYSLGEVVKWLDRKRKEAPDEATEKARLEKLRADKLAIEIQEMLKKFVDRDLALRAVERGIIGARGILMNLPRLVAAEVPQDVRGEVEELVRKVVEGVLKELEECKEIDG